MFFDVHLERVIIVLRKGGLVIEITLIAGIPQVLITLYDSLR